MAIWSPCLANNGESTDRNRSIERRDVQFQDLTLNTAGTTKIAGTFTIVSNMNQTVAALTASFATLSKETCLELIKCFQEPSKRIFVNIQLAFRYYQLGGGFRMRNPMSQL
jgi:hypothetical protein